MNTPRKAIYPGSFDPFTHGHLDILDRALRLFPEITIVVASSTKKTPWLTLEDRLAMIRKTVADRPGVTVDSWSGLIMEYARSHHVSAVIRGLRAASDFEYEFMMASMNKRILPEVETVFMMTSQNLYFVSSSMIRELYAFGGDVSEYLPDSVLRAIQSKKKS